MDISWNPSGSLARMKNHSVIFFKVIFPVSIPKLITRQKSVCPNTTNRPENLRFWREYDICIHPVIDPCEEHRVYPRIGLG